MALPRGAAENLLISVFFLIYACFVVSVPIVPTTDVGDTVEERYSAAPNNTPISKVYIFGRPVYIREPFVVPQRNYSEQIDFSKLFDEAKQRKNRASYRENAYKPPNYPTGPGAYTGGGVYVTNKQSEYATNKYPLKQCYTEKSGYMCCNLRLENVMHDTAMKMKESKGCNLQKMSTMLANISETVFGTDFEAISAIGDFASKIHFYSDYVCKMKRDGRTLLVYATPERHNDEVPYRTGYPTYTPYTL